MLLILCSKCLFATHYRGGEITYKITGPLTVEATVTTYTKISYPSNLADKDSISVSWGDGTSNIIPRINGSNDSTCLGSSPCGIVIAADIKQSIYRGSHTYTGLLPNTNYFAITFLDDNMLGGIANIEDGNSVNVPFFVEATVYMGTGYDAFPGGYDASPIFLNSPKYYGFVNDTFTFNSAGYDPNGDSLSYGLIIPRTDQNDNVPQYVFPDAFCIAAGSGQSNTLEIKAQTGEIIWASPCVEGFFQLCIEVRQFHCGLFIGSVMRNMQIIAIAQHNHVPELSSMRDTIIQPGQLIEFNISSKDSDVTDVDSIQMLGEAFLHTQNAPIFSATTGNPATGIFSWQPDVSFARSTSYLFTVVATDNFMTNGPNGIAPFPGSAIEAFRVWVRDTADACQTTGIDKLTPSALPVQIFPNPTNGLLHVEADQQISEVVIYDLSGRAMQHFSFNNKAYDLTTSGLDGGVYLLSIVTESLTVTRKFIKIE